MSLVGVSLVQYLCFISAESLLCAPRQQCENPVAVQQDAGAASEPAARLNECSSDHV